MSEREPRFIVDTNVGHLARKLRMLGYDTLFIDPIHDAELIEIAAREGRVIVSGDRRLFDRRLLRSGKIQGVWVDTSQDHLLQLRHIVRAVGRGGIPFVRCLDCNTLLTPKTREEAKGRVPPLVYETVEEYTYCLRCDRLFWNGTHMARMREQIEQLSA